MHRSLYNISIDNIILDNKMEEPSAPGLPVEEEDVQQECDHYLDSGGDNEVSEDDVNGDSSSGM